MPPRALILRAPGTNCDEETAYAFELAGADGERMHVNRLLESPQQLAEFQILCIPGGFSYGDDVAAGKILALRLRHHLADVLQQFRDDGNLILGICNGFQVLLSTGLLLPDDPRRGPGATLTWNSHGRYEDRWVRLAVDGGRSFFLRGFERIELPIAHAEGRFVARDDAALDWLDVEGQLVLRYTDEDGNTSNDPLPFPANPNGSQANVAALCDTTGRVLGMMPHPERYLHPTNHPQWTRRPSQDHGDGLKVFQNAVGYFDE